MQSRLASAFEVACGTAVGALTALAVQAVVFPLYEIDVSAAQHAQISAIFTAVSLIRGYIVRRAFNAIGVRGWAALGSKLCTTSKPR